MLLNVWIKACSYVKVTYKHAAILYQYVLQGLLAPMTLLNAGTRHA
jgi:hypothetical protein